ncbi:hypothetical protein F5B18DRAFT_43424 [Nemania serpens]|nr:hypothetical protein F5B18DRAFT_43424 [Nemania serpens]
MQRLVSPSIIPRFQANTRLWQCQTRHARKRAGQQRKGALRRRSATFQISNLLLDLDAFEARGVRPFDAMIDGVPEPSYAQRERELAPIEERVADFEQAYTESNANFCSVAFNKLHPLHISDFDFLAVALLDSASISDMAVDSKSHLNNPVSHPDILHSVLYKNGIPSVAWKDTSNTIAYMLRRRHLVSRPVPPRPEYADEEELVRRALRKKPNVTQIDRLVARVAKLPRGCQILLRVSDELYASLIRLPKAEPLQLLSLLNNLVLNLDRYELDLPTKFHDLGIRISLKCQAIVTAQHYIKRRLKHRHFDHRFVNSLLDKLLQTSIASSPSPSYAFQLDSSDRLAAVFSLLTGYVPGENQLAVSLRTLGNPERPDGFHLYIQCLARLGAFRTIWHEWHNINSTSRSEGAGARQDLASAENDYFLTAILKALAKNHRIGELAESPSFTNVSGRFQEDCQLDMIAISRSANALALPEKKIGGYIYTPIYAERREQLYQILGEKRMEDAFPALQKFLILTTSSP